jgi:hypothetical protein
VPWGRLGLARRLGWRLGGTATAYRRGLRASPGE